MKKCPYCAEEIQDEAKKCKHCSEFLNDKPTTDHRDIDNAEKLPVQQTVTLAKSRGVYIILGLFFGCFGIHNFYAGYNKNGAIQLVITTVLGWLVIGIIITAIWALLDVITIKKDAAGNAMS